MDPLRSRTFAAQSSQHVKCACLPHYRIQLVLGRARIEIFKETASVPGTECLAEGLFENFKTTVLAIVSENRCLLRGLPDGFVWA